jgi:GNAT superfamily N-acetyltransferase
VIDPPNGFIGIREAGPGDAEALAHLIGVLGYDLDAAGVVGRLVQYGTPWGRVFLAESGGRVVGFLSFHLIPLFHESGSLGRITALAVDADCHRMGIGRSLVAAAETFALANGCSRIEVTSGDHREHDAHLFYADLGYASDCRRFLKHLTASPAAKNQTFDGNLVTAPTQSVRKGCE